MPENTGKIQGSSQFKRGQSGNPKGKPKGARNKSTLAAEKLLEGSFILQVVQRDLLLPMTSVKKTSIISY